MTSRALLIWQRFPCGRLGSGSTLKRLVQLLELLQQPLAGKDHVVVASLLVALHFRLLRSPVADRRLPKAMAAECDPDHSDAVDLTGRALCRSQRHACRRPIDIVGCARARNSLSGLNLSGDY